MNVFRYRGFSLPRLALLLWCAWALRGVAFCAAGEPAVDRYGDPLPAGAIARLGSVAAGAVPPRGHEAGLIALAFAPDGTKIASLGTDNTIRVWEVASGHELWQQRAKRPLLWSPDGAYVLSGGSDDALHLWDVATAHELGVLPGSCDWAMFLPGGKNVAVFMNGNVFVFEALTGRSIKRYDAPSSSLALSPDGRILAATSGSSDSLVRLFDLESGKFLRSLSGAKEISKAVAFSPDGALFAFAGRDKQTYLWEAQTGTALGVLKGHEDAIQQVAFSPDARFIATASWDKTVRIWETASGLEICKLQGHTQIASAVAFSKDGKLLATGSIDRTALIWDVERVTQGLPAEKPLEASELEGLWSDLASDQGGQAYAAIRRLKSDPAMAIPFLKERLQSILVPQQSERIAELIAQLDHDEYMVRERATRALIALRDVAGELLRQELERTRSAEVRFRIRSILATPPGKPRLSKAELNRGRRLIDVLESSATPEAIALLQSLAEEAIDPSLSAAAKEALQRLGPRAS
jgi:hypothetical protein